MRFYDLGAFGESLYPGGTEEGEWCNREYPWHHDKPPDAPENKLNARCRIIQFPDIAMNKPWTDFGRKMRGMPGRGIVGSAADSVSKADLDRAAAQLKDKAGGGKGSGPGSTPAGGGLGKQYEDIATSTGGKIGGAALVGLGVAALFLLKRKGR